MTASGRALRTARPRRDRVVLALSGVDGSGKSTVAKLLEQRLAREGLPVTRVWSRPGCGLAFLDGVVTRVRRTSTSDTRSGSRRIADPRAPTPRSRRGLVGWLWALVVTVAYLAHARRLHRRAVGIVVCDRHLADALVSLDFFYARGARSPQAWLVRRLLPRAHLAYYLDVDTDAVVARQPASSTTRYAVEQQLVRYREVLGRHHIRRMDATTDPEHLVEQIVDEVVQARR